MVRKLGVFVLCFIVLFSLAGCSGHPSFVGPQPLGSHFATASSAGGKVAVTVDDSVKCGLVEEGIPLVDDGAGMKIDVELLLAQEPDFAIASADFVDKMLKEFRTVNIADEAGALSEGLFLFPKTESLSTWFHLITGIANDAQSVGIAKTQGRELYLISNVT